MYYHIDPNTLSIISGPHAVDSTAIKKLTSCGNPELLNLADYDLVPAAYAALGENQRHASTPVVTADAVTFPAEDIPQEELDSAAEALRASQTISRHQAKTALANHGLLDIADQVVAEMSQAAQIAWNDAPEFHRTSPALLTVATALGLSAEAVDALFAEALTITV